MDIINELNYVCNSEIFRIAYVMKTTLKAAEGDHSIKKKIQADRSRVAQWVDKIMKCNRTLSDLRLRNEFLKVLAEAVKAGKLIPPFDMDPPKSALKSLVRQLLGDEGNPLQDDENTTMLRFLPAKHGGYILPKPLPAIGAYCYISTTSQVECFKKGLE